MYFPHHIGRVLLSSQNNGFYFMNMASYERLNFLIAIDFKGSYLHMILSKASFFPDLHVLCNHVENQGHFVFISCGKEIEGAVSCLNK